MHAFILSQFWSLKVQKKINLEKIHTDSFLKFPADYNGVQL